MQVRETSFKETVEQNDYKHLLINIVHHLYEIKVNVI